MRLVQTVLGVAAAACLTVAPVDAGQKGNGKGGGATHAQAPAPKTHAPAPATTTTQPATKQHGNPHVTTTSTSTTTPTTTTSTTTKTTKKTTTPTTTTSTTTTTSSTNTTNSTNTTQTDTTTLSPLAAKIQSHPQLASRLKALLPDGMTLNRAATGFKNQGQLIAALHVSRNLNIPFRQLKADMTGPDHLSLGQAIQKRRSTANATAEVSRAETEANEDVKLSTAPVTRKGKRGGSQ